MFGIFKLYTNVDGNSETSIKCQSVASDLGFIVVYF